MNWRTVLVDLLASGSFRTQGELVRAIASHTGSTVNQATVSRELHTLGIVKVDGFYRLPPAPAIGAPIHSFKVTANSALAVIKTDPAYANVIAQAIDAEAPAGVLGTIAGDDTVFIALADDSAIPGIRRLLGLPPRRIAA